MPHPSAMPGTGDEATWGECTGHPNDPRSDDLPEYDDDGNLLDDNGEVVMTAAEIESAERDAACEYCDAIKEAKWN